MLGEGTTIGAYRVLHKLGEGGMGAVYVAEHTLLGRKAAIKVLLPALSASDEILQRFFNEARAVTQIADPGIVQVFDFGRHTDGSAFLVMELLEGETVDRRLERVGRLSPIDGVRLLRLICRSLCTAHARGIVHRDLKPENLIIIGDPAVTGGERPKILDFGIAKLSHSEPGALKTRTGMMMGTPVYMSPEQCRGAGDVDHRADIYSIGCVMITMLTGRPPFDGDASGDLIVAHLREPPPLIASRIAGAPAVLDTIAQRCLAKAPADRFATMAELVAALDAADAMLTRGEARAAGAGATPMPWQPTATGATATLRAPVTTLGGAAGHAIAHSVAAPARGRGRVAGLVLATAVLAGAATRGVAYLTTRDRDATTAAARPVPAAVPPAAVPPAAPAAVPPAAVVPPDAPAAVPPAAPAAVPPAATPPITAPAAVPPAALPPAAVPPAAVVPAAVPPEAASAAIGAPADASVDAGPRLPAPRPHRATNPRRPSEHALIPDPSVPVDRGD